MICESLKCIFVHTPKVAGESVELFFCNLLGVPRDTLLLKPNPDPNLGPYQLSHLTAEEYIRFGYMTPDQFNTYYKFSFVRNPWTRLVSEYINRYIRCFSFKDFVFKNFPKPDSFCDFYRHVIPQYDFLYDSEGNCLVDFVGRFENLQSDFNFVCKKLDIKNSKLPHHNSTKNRSFPNLKEYNPHKPYWDYYDDDTLEFVAKFYSKDIKAFNYKFGE